MDSLADFGWNIPGYDDPKTKGDSIPVMMINDMLILCKYIIELQLAVSYIIHNI